MRFLAEFLIWNILFWNANLFFRTKIEKVNLETLFCKKIDNFMNRMFEERNFFLFIYKLEVSFALDLFLGFRIRADLDTSTR